MAEREAVHQKLKKKHQACLRRRKWLWFFMIAEIVILWIRNPGFIPGISTEVSAIQTFLGELLWPHSLEELGDGTYRAYIFLISAWVESLPFYPALELIVPRIVPMWLMISYIRGGILRIRIRNAQKPPKEKSVRPPRSAKRKWRLPAIHCSFGPKVEGLYMANRGDANRRFRKLQECCEKLRPENPHDWELDGGLWVGNRKRGREHLPDLVYSWGKEGIIEIPLQSDVLRFVFCSDGVQLYTDDGTLELQKGVPLYIKHKNAGGNEVLDMTVTWLGGIV